MRSQQSGSIILTASVAGFTAWSHAAPYCATKAAVIQLAKVAAVEYARDGIRVNCVCPGTFRSRDPRRPPTRGARRDRGEASARPGIGGRPGGRLLVPRERRRRAGRPGRRSWSTAATRRRSDLRGAIADDASGHELGRGARAPRPDRTPTKPLAVFGDETVTYGEMATRVAALAAGLHERGVGAGDVVGLLVVQLHRVPGDDLRRELPGRDRDADQLAARRAGAALHPRPLRSPRARVRRVARRSRQRSDDGDGSARSSASASPHRARRVDAARRPARRPTGPPRVAVERRRRAPADVHVGDDRATEGRDDHPRQPGVEEPRAHRRVRLHERRSRARPAGRCTTSARSTSRPRR